MDLLGDNVAIMSAEELQLVQRLLELDQGHLFADWPAAGLQDNKKKEFLSQLLDLNSKYPGGLEAYIKKARSLLANSALGVNPFEGYTPSVPEGQTLKYGTEQFLRAEQSGLRAACHTGFVLVAGGLGERLGYDGIKLSLPVETTSNTTYLQVYVDYILALQEQCRSLEGDSSITLPLAIMVSDDTDQKTRQLLADNNDFGMAPGQITIVKQDKVPAVGDVQAHLVLRGDDPFQVETKPHGHGDVHILLNREGVARAWQQQSGVEWVFFLQDTNALVINSVLPALGVSALNDYHMNSICIPRAAKEEAGAITKLTHSDGTSLIINVEYNQLGPLLQANSPTGEGDVNDPATGLSPYPGNANNIVFKMDQYLKVLEGEDQGVVVEFVNPKYKDEARTLFKKPARLESMMQDFPKLMSKELGNHARIGFTTLDKWLSFSPAKNSLDTGAGNAKNGVPPATVSSGEAENYAATARKMKETTGCELGEPEEVEFEGVTFPLGPRIVLKPSFAVTQDQLKQKISSNVKISTRSSLILEGEGIKLDSLDLDGALSITVEPGVHLTVRDLAVNNAGWKFTELSQSEHTTPEAQVRGYTLVKEGTQSYHITEPGNYVLGSDGKVVQIPQSA
uniref:UTP-monosaccharide-1-phosphate uridylyltransferase n=1 Tax=Fibrocapsa japonica TaxID=94617 RepID=A0A7S2Y4M2_9STRA